MKKSVLLLLKLLLVTSYDLSQTIMRIGNQQN